MPARSRYRGDANAPRSPSIRRQRERQANRPRSIGLIGTGERARPAPTIDRRDDRVQRRIDRSARAVSRGGAAQQLRSADLDDKGTTWPAIATQANKEADLAGPGIGDYEELERVLPDRLPLAPDAARDAAGDLRGQGLHRGAALPRAQPDDGPGAAHRRRRVGRQRHARSRWLADAGHVPYRERPRPTSDRRPGGPGGDQVEEDRAPAVRIGRRARASAPTCGRCARTTSSITTTAPYVDQWDWERVITADQRNLDYLEADRPGDLEGPPRRRAARPGAVPRTPDRALPGPARRARRSSTPRTSSTGIRTCRASSARRSILQEFPAVFIIGIGWTLADGYPHEMRAADYDDWATETTSAGRSAMPRAERRHPRLEPRDEAPPRADLDGDPRRRRRRSGASSRSPASSTGSSCRITAGSSAASCRSASAAASASRARRCSSSRRRTSARSASPSGRRSSRTCAGRGTSTSSSNATRWRSVKRRLIGRRAISSARCGRSGPGDTLKGCPGPT